MKHVLRVLRAVIGGPLILVFGAVGLLLVPLLLLYVASECFWEQIVGWKLDD